jgi:hypothetical protein
MFEFQPLVAPPPLDAGRGGNGETQVDDSRGVVVIGVHSRHADDHDDGSNIRGEVECIDRVLAEEEAQRRQPSSSSSPADHGETCRIVIMSDRSRTLELLRERASVRWNCSVVTAHEPATTPATNRSSSVAEPDSASSLSSSTSSWRSEHGPYSGIGFYRDWALMVSHARTMRGFVGRKRSSSLLVREVVEYDRIEQQRQHHQHQQLLLAAEVSTRVARESEKGSSDSGGPVAAPSSARPLTTCLLPY